MQESVTSAKLFNFKLAKPACLTNYQSYSIIALYFFLTENQDSFSFCLFNYLLSVCYPAFSVSPYFQIELIQTNDQVVVLGEIWEHSCSWQLWMTHINWEANNCEFILTVVILNNIGKT